MEIDEKVAEEMGYKIFHGVLIEKEKKVSFTVYKSFPEIKVGDWFNCLDREDFEQKYCVEKIIDGIYFFKKVWYDHEKGE